MWVPLSKSRTMCMSRIKAVSSRYGSWPVRLVVSPQGWAKLEAGAAFIETP